MPIAPKQIIAGVVLLGAATVWVPRMTGFDPLGLLAKEEPPSFSTVPTSEGMTVPTASPEEAVASDKQEIPLGALEKALTFLDNRGSDAGGPQPSVRQAEPQAAVRSDAPLLAAAQGLLEPAHAEPGEEGPTMAQRIELFLAQNPLHVIIRGQERTTATFGLYRVEAGHALMEDLLRVTAIDMEGVLFESPVGPLRVQLPPRGARLPASAGRGTAPERATVTTEKEQG